MGLELLELLERLEHTVKSLWVKRSKSHEHE